MKKAGWIALIISAVLVMIAGTAAAGQEISPRAFRDDETDIWQYNYPEGPEE